MAAIGLWTLRRVRVIVPGHGMEGGHRKLRKRRPESNLSPLHGNIDLTALVLRLGSTIISRASWIAAHRPFRGLRCWMSPGRPQTIRQRPPTGTRTRHLDLQPPKANTKPRKRNERPSRRCSRKVTSTLPRRFLQPLTHCRQPLCNTKRRQGNGVWTATAVSRAKQTPLGRNDRILGERCLNPRKRHQRPHLTAGKIFITNYHVPVLVPLSPSSVMPAQVKLMTVSILAATPTQRGRDRELGELQRHRVLIPGSMRA